VLSIELYARNCREFLAAAIGRTACPLCTPSIFFVFDQDRDHGSNDRTFIGGDGPAVFSSEGLYTSANTINADPVDRFGHYLIEIVLGKILHSSPYSTSPVVYFVQRIRVLR
jgi:hypothetical protein